MTSASTARSLVATHGVVRPQPQADWLGTFQLPAQLAEYYRDVGPVDVTIPGYGNPYFLPCLATLWEFQEGYRWNSLDGARLEEWDDDWVVVADEGGDPFILSRATGRILFAQHGMGVWEPSELFTDLNMMAASLAALGALVVSAGECLTDAESYIRPERMAEAEFRLTELVGSKRFARAVLETLGWGGAAQQGDEADKA